MKPNYAMAFILKGSLVLAEGNLEEAPKLFLQANNIRKDIYSYKGKPGSGQTDRHSSIRFLGSSISWVLRRQRDGVW